VSLIGDKYRAEVGVTDDLITFSVTLHDVDWLIQAFTAALASLSLLENWTDEYSDGLIETGRSYGAALGETVEFMDRVGEINPYIVSDTTMLPPNVLPCTGLTYDIDEYPKLAARLPASLVGETTFVTPDLRGRTLIGAGTGAGLTTRTVATALGEETHTLTEAEMPSHFHLYTPPIPNVDLEAPGVPDITAAGVSPTTTGTGGAGGDQAHNNMQPSYVIIWGVIAA
jgi:microcystin-dependent protein